MKSVPEELELKANKVFTSKENLKILEKLILELLRLMVPKYKPSQKQLQSWLMALHRHQRGRFLKKQSGKLEDDNRRIHANSRLSEV